MTGSAVEERARLVEEIRVQSVEEFLASTVSTLAVLAQAKLAQAEPDLPAARRAIDAMTALQPYVEDGSGSLAQALTALRAGYSALS